MKFTYAGAKYDFVDPSTWTTLEAIALERHTGVRVGGLMTEFVNGSPLGVHATVWVSLRRAGVDIAWNALELPYADTMNSFEGEPVTEPPDPSTASTGAPKAGTRSRSARARSAKK